MTPQDKCKICKSHAKLFTTYKVLNKHNIEYFRCNNCGFIQTEEPYWLNEAYSEAISSTDIGMINRNMILSKISQAVISFLFDRKGAFLDYGGGYGIFVRIMRDHGFEFYLYDKYCKNLFAKGFEENNIGKNRYELLTAFEIFEHLTNPMESIENMLSCSNNILFTTDLIPNYVPKPGSWWYYAPESGQHIAFYTLNSLNIIARAFDLKIYSNGKNIHLLTKKKVPDYYFKLITQYNFATILNLFYKNESLLSKDYHKISGNELK